MAHELSVYGSRFTGHDKPYLNHLFLLSVSNLKLEKRTDMFVLANFSLKYIERRTYMFAFDASSFYGLYLLGKQRSLKSDKV